MIARCLFETKKRVSVRTSIRLAGALVEWLYEVSTH